MVTEKGGGSRRCCYFQLLLEKVSGGRLKKKNLECFLGRCCKVALGNVHQPTHLSCIIRVWR